MMERATQNRQSIERLTALNDALQALLKICTPVAGVSKPVAQAVGCVAAHRVTPTRLLPEMRIALRDGYAVAAGDTLGASPYTPTLSLSPPAWMSSGNALPAKTDAVLPVYAVQADSLPVEILMQAAPGDGTRAPGDDLDTTMPILQTGDLTTPLPAAFLLAAGMREVGVRQPRLQIYTRDDVLEDLVGPCFKAMAERLGVAAALARVSMRDAATLAETFRSTDADMIVSVGGTGSSADDCAAQALQQAGTLLAHGLAYHPGETAGCGMVANSGKAIPVILAPGRLEAALAIFLALARPCLAAMMQSRPFTAETWPLARKLTSNPGIADLVLLHRSLQGERVSWEPLATGDVPWHVLARAHAFHILPPQSEGMPAGEMLGAELV